MKCELIFYMARRTDKIEDVLQKALGPLGIELEGVTAATNGEELRDAVKLGVTRRNLLLITGGLAAGGEKQTARLMSKILSLPLSSVNPPAFLSGKRVSAGEGPEGHLLESGRQSIALLPDDPETLEPMLTETVIPFLCQKYGLTPPHRELSEAEKTEKLCREIQESGGEPLAPEAQTAFGSVTPAPVKKKRGGILSILLTLVIILALAAAALCFLYASRLLPGLNQWIDQFLGL